MVDSVIPMTGGEFKAVISLINSKWYISWNTVSYGPDTSAINSGIISLRLNGSTFDAWYSTNSVPDISFSPDSVTLSVLDPTSYTNRISTPIDLSDITGSVTEYDHFSSNPYFFQADKQKTTSGGEICKLKAAYVNSSVDLAYNYFTTDGIQTLQVDTKHDKNIPYNVSLVMTDNSALPSFVLVDETSFSNNGSIILTFDFPSIGSYYNVSDLYEFNIKVNLLKYHL